MVTQQDEIKPEGLTRFFSFGWGQPYGQFFVKITVAEGRPETPRELMTRFHGQCWAFEYDPETWLSVVGTQMTQCLLEVWLPEHASHPFYRVLGGRWR